MQKENDFITIPISQLARNNTKELTLLNKITLQANTNNIANVNYTTGGTNGHSLNPLNKLFCDNVILYYNLPLPSKDIRLDDYLKAHLPEYTERVKRLFNEYNITINKRAIKPTQYKTTNNTLTQYIKVALQDTPLEDVMQICKIETIQKFNDNNIHINDMDFTRDYAGVIQKDEVIDYLVKEHKYEYSVNSGQSLYNQDAEYKIIDNNNTVSNNCISIIHTAEQFDIRYKIYNKFVQMCESPSVRNNVGNHFANWIECPERILRESINKSIDTGLLRLEITFYVNNRPIKLDYIQQHIDYLERLLPPKLVYYNPIKTQWNLLLSNVHYNMLVYDTDNSIALLSYYINKDTSKIAGFYIPNATEDKIQQIAKLYTFNLPVVVLQYKTIDNDTLDAKDHCEEIFDFHNSRIFDSRNSVVIHIQQTTYQKVLLPSYSKQSKITELITYLTAGSKEFKPKYSISTNPNTVGFVDNAICRFRPAKKIQPNKVSIELQKIDNILPLSKYMGNIRINTKELQLEEEFKRLNVSIIETTKLQNKIIDALQNLHEKECNNIQEQIEQLRQDKQHIRNHLCKSFESKANKPLYLPDKITYYVYGYKDVSKTNSRILLALSTEPKITTNTQLQIYLADKTIRDCIYTYEKEELWYKIADHVYGRDNGEPIFAVRRNGYTYKSNNKIPIFDIILHYTDENANEIDNEEIDDKQIELEIRQHNNTICFRHNPICSKCPKIDDIAKQGDVITILDIYPYKGSNLVKCKVNGLEITCKSNKWMDEIIDVRDYEFNVVAGIAKRHPIAKRKILSFVV